jgi:hypothetical protein
MSSPFAGFSGCFVRRIGGIGGRAVGVIFGVESFRLGWAGSVGVEGRALLLGLVRIVFGL